MQGQAKNENNNIQQRTQFDEFHNHSPLLTMDTFKTFSMEVSDVKIPWNAKSRRYFHFKLQQGDEETKATSLCLGKLEKIGKKRATDFQLT